MTKKNLNFAVLGAHGRGITALNCHLPEQGLRLIAASSLSLDNLDHFRKACGDDLFLTTDYREILARPDVDAVLICTPDFVHVEHATAAFKAGKDVFLEKPMGITIEECDAIIAAAKKYGRKLYMGHNMRFFPVIRKMKELIDAGCIGRVEAIWCRHFINYGGDAYYKDWHSERKNSTGLLLQKGAHDIDIIHYLAGGYTRRVVGMGKLSVYNEVADRRRPDEAHPIVFDDNHWPPQSQTGLSPAIDVEDHNMILMQLDNGVQASYEQCHYTPDSCRNYTIIGTKGRIENYGDHSTENQLACIHLWNRRAPYSPSGQEVFEIPYSEGGHGGADPMLRQDFFNFLRGEKSTGATPMDARMSVAAGYLATQSLRNGSVPFDVPPLPADLCGFC